MAYERITTPNDIFWAARHLANAYRRGLLENAEQYLRRQGRWEETLANLEAIGLALVPFEEEEEEETEEVS